MATLELNGLRKSFGLINVLHGIDLALADGEMLVIVGASGCGKESSPKRRIRISAFAARRPRIGASRRCNAARKRALLAPLR